MKKIKDQLSTGWSHSCIETNAVIACYDCVTLYILYSYSGRTIYILTGGCGAVGVRGRVLPYSSL